MIHSIFIINRSGGLIYNKNYSNNIAQLSSNEALIFAGTFHGIHALASRISPATKARNNTIRDSGIETIDTRNFRIHCFQTPTGIKFIAVSDVLETRLSDVLSKVYVLYSDYALKNPFYNLEMPIRSEMFDVRLLQLVHAH
ncbi:Sybindin-like protein [Kickxella alabastrina]|uniref:Sybindin-like protein n=1 Tax=Kickxella alabastrina TaxID=61397 RepID=UPI00221FF0CA|nr:Sybindin-like protein [Kickxella alabastrina]KAI7820108.1 Sybindin-like protein [Kickxella alabastrina]